MKGAIRMGKVYTPTYRVEITTPVLMGGSFKKQTDSHVWEVKSAHGRQGKGTPTDANLEKYIMAYAKSLETGGVNAHLSAAIGHVPYPTSAKIIHQASGSVMAVWQAAPFQVW